MENLKAIIEASDAILVGAGAGLSTSAGFTYSGPRFHKYFADFEEKYGFHDMYSGGFTHFESLEEYWAYWSRQIYLNRYENPPKPLYEKLLSLIEHKDYFVLTTNVDHCFQKALFSKDRLFYTQGDYGLWQCTKPCHNKTYDNKDTVVEMLKSQGFEIKEGKLEIEELKSIKMTVPESLVPKCPKCGSPMTMNLRCDNSFVEDEGWHNAALLYQEFLEKHKESIIYLELGVGDNTPGIIKYPFWRLTYNNPMARYITINNGNSYIPKEIEKQSLSIHNDIYEVLQSL